MNARRRLDPANALHAQLTVEHQQVPRFHVDRALERPTRRRSRSFAQTR